MDKNIAKLLVEETEKRRIIALNNEQKNKLIALLESTPISDDSSRFHEIITELPDNDVLIEDGGDRYHYIQLRRILRNKNAKDYQQSGMKRLYERAVSLFGIYDSNVLTRRIRGNKELVDMMVQCSCPFSLLGKLETWDYSNKDEKMFAITKPIFVIPNAKNTEAISKWESDNTKYESSGFLFRHHISKETYENA